MPWVRAVLNGKRVFARADASGRLVEGGGRVEVRYRLPDGAPYRARPANLAVEEGGVLPDDTTGAANPAEGGRRRRAPSPSPSVAKATEPRLTASERMGAVAGGSATRGSTPTTTSTVTAARGSDQRERRGEAPARGVAPPPGGPIPAIVAFADGACSGNPGPCGLGLVLVDGATTVETSEYLGTGTNNIAELTAVERAIEAAPPGPRALVVHTDSQYAIGVLARGWKAKANRDLVARVRAKVGARRAELVYVRGHSGVPLNERADRLAREAVETGRSWTRRGGAPC